MKFTECSSFFNGGICGRRSDRKSFEQLIFLHSVLSHNQFVCTSHKVQNGQAKEATEYVEKRDQTPEDMKQAYEHMKQMFYDLDLRLITMKKGKTYGVSYTIH